MLSVAGARIFEVCSNKRAVDATREGGKSDAMLAMQTVWSQNWR